MDAIGDRWTLVLVRHLLSGPKGFQELRVRSGIAPRVLSARLRQLGAAGLVVSNRDGTRPVYRVTDRGRSLEPVISAIARWYLRHGLENLKVDPSSFSATSALSVLESLPHMLREDRARDVDLTFEIRLTGLGGGVWTVRIQDGACSISPGFAERADVRYTADARVWCAVALGIEDAREVYRRGLMTKDGSHEAMDRYFYQVSELRHGDSAAGNGSSARAQKRKRRRKAE
jgi:DNA-binding HxlR family transcriptional regulator